LEKTWALLSAGLRKMNNDNFIFTPTLLVGAEGQEQKHKD